MTDRSALIAQLRAAGCVFAEDEAELLLTAATSEAELAQWVGRRINGEPLEQLIGWVEFHGRRIQLAPGVFVPRRRTELMATIAIERLRPGAVLVELCCGAGAVTAVAAGTIANLQVWAADCDPAAVGAARRNLPADRVLLGDLYQPLPPRLRGHIDVLAANAPYVPTDSIALMPPEARLYEATVALDGGTDGLDVVRRVLADAPHWLAPHGSLLVEAGSGQLQALSRFADQLGLIPTVHTDPEIGAIVVELRLRPNAARRGANRDANDSGHQPLN